MSEPPDIVHELRRLLSDCARVVWLGRPPRTSGQLGARLTVIADPRELLSSARAGFDAAVCTQVGEDLVQTLFGLGEVVRTGSVVVVHVPVLGATASARARSFLRGLVPGAEPARPLAELCGALVLAGLGAAHVVAPELSAPLVWARRPEACPSLDLTGR